MKHPYWLSGLLLAGCVTTAPPVAPGTPGPVPTGAPGPTAVQTVLPTPPTPTPSASVYSPAPCSSQTPCLTVSGHVFDRAGQPVSGRLDVNVTMVDHPETVVATATGAEGAYSVVVPQANTNLVLTVSAEGHAPRQRPYGGRRFYSTPGVPAAGGNPGMLTLDFGGPASSTDPDSPAYYLPAPGESGQVISPSPVLPFEDTTVSTVAGDGSNETLWYPGGLAVASDGQILVTEAASHNRISQVSPDGKVSVLAGGPVVGHYPNEVYLRDGRGTEAIFYEPSDIVLDPDGNAYVADTGNSAVRKITPDGTVTTIAGHRPYGYQDGVGTQAALWGPTGVAVDSHRNVFVADAGNFCIRKIAPDGTVTTFAGTNQPGYANGEGQQARFRSPSRLAVDGHDNLYVADSGNHRIRKITPAGVVSDAYGTPTNRADGAVELPAMDGFVAIAVDRAGNLYAATDERVYRIAPDGRVSIAAGYGLWGYVDGPGKSAYFAGLAGLTIDAAGNLFVSETGNSRIRRISFTTPAPSAFHDQEKSE